jgi:hypothetical protein
MDDNLLGYLLNALEPDEHRQVEEYLQTQPATAAKLERLRQMVAPLSADAEQAVPPSNLLVGTLALIAEVKCRPPLPPAPPTPRPKERRPRDWHWIRRADIVLAASLLLVAGGLVSTWIMHTHEQAQRLNCQNNLHKWWGSLEKYSDGHANSFPCVEETGPHAVAGIFVPMLNDAGLVTADMSVGCPAQRLIGAPPYSTQGLEQMFRSDLNGYQAVAPSLARDYGYTLGYRDEMGQLQGLRRDSGDLLPLLADRPPLVPAGDSPNHGGLGQNVLYIGGHVRWCKERTVGVDLDDIYLSKNGRIEAGLNRADSVLAPSEATPYVRQCHVD